MGMYGLNGTLQDLGIATKLGETVAMASFVRNGHLSLLISGPQVQPYKAHKIPRFTLQRYGESYCAAQQEGPGGEGRQAFNSFAS